MSLNPKTKVILDTSAINALEDFGPRSDALMGALAVGYDLRLTAMSADEIIALANNPERRDALLRRFSWLLNSAECIWPPNEIVRLHVKAYHNSPNHYDWHQVDVRAREYEQAISRRILPLDISAEQRRVHLELEVQFRRAWNSLRPKLDEVIKRTPSQRLRTFNEAADACVKDGGVLWGFGAGLYAHALKINGPELTDEQVRPFIEQSPPFRAACYCLVKAWFNFSLRPTHERIPKAGRNDLMMAVYLPYGDMFLTSDYAQKCDLTDIATVAGIPCEVTAFHDFDRSFDVSSAQ